MDKVRRIFSTGRAHDGSAAASNNNGPTAESLAKSASNTFGIPGRTTFSAAWKIKFNAYPFCL